MPWAYWASGRTAKRAAFNVLLLLGGMVAAYYLTAALTGGAWGMKFLIGWGVAALLSPIPGWLVWFAGGRRPLAWALSLGVPAVQTGLVIFLFGKVRPLDAGMILLTAAVLLWNKVVGKRVF